MQHLFEIEGGVTPTQRVAYLDISRDAFRIAVIGETDRDNGARAFVACSGDNYVAIVDLKSLTVTGQLKVGGNPDGMAWAVRP